MPLSFEDPEKIEFARGYCEEAVSLLERERDQALAGQRVALNNAALWKEAKLEAEAQRDALHFALLEAINVHPIIEEYPATKEALAGLEES